MTIDSTLYRSIGNLTDWLVRFSIIMIILSIITMAADFYITLSGGFDDDSQISIADIIGTFVSIISILIIIIMLIWFYRATKNIHSFGADWVSDEPGNPTLFGPEITYVSKNFGLTLFDTANGVPLKSNAIELVMLPDHDAQELWFQVRIPVGGVSGSLHQEVTIDLIC